MRSASVVNDGRPRSSSATISPSSHASSGSASASPANSGYAAVTSAPLRAYSRNRLFPAIARARTPSHLNSYDQPGPVGSGPVEASIGAPGTEQPYPGLYAGDLERRGLLRSGVDRREAVLRHRGEGHPIPSGTPDRRRAHPL